jgi:hypothetical protein
MRPRVAKTTINDPRDFRLSKRLTNLPALRQIGFTANRRLLGVQRLSHNPIRGAQAFTELTAPIITDVGTRIPGLRFGDTRVHALLQALLIHPRNRLPQIAGIMAGAAFPGRGATRCSSVAGQVGVGAKPASRASSAAWSGPTKGG